MILRDVVERFEKKAPACVMVRAALENVLSEERLDRMFEHTAQRQENKQILFSTIAEIMGLVAFKIQPSVHAAYQANPGEVGATVKALYDKLQRMESNVSRQFVRQTAVRMAQTVDRMEGGVPELLPGYRVKILDGNHLRRTQRRLKELRELNSAPLPGHCAVILDPRRKLAIDVIPCEDGHAQERSLLPQIEETIEPKDAWIADRNFCTTGFLFGVAGRGAFFVIRQHQQSLRWELVGKRKKIGRCDTGMVYEQAMQIFDAQGNVMTIRRVTVELDEPTRDGDREIHILTNLPKRITAIPVAELYRKRWTIETAFQEVAQNLEGEIETLGYPKAALFAFCTALVAFNVMSLILAAMRAVHGEETVGERVSLYYLCHEVASTYAGLAIAVPDAYWRDTYADLTPSQLGRKLTGIAKTMHLERYRKHKRGRKKPVPKMCKKGRPHISTARVLAKARTPTNSKKC